MLFQPDLLRHTGNSFLALIPAWTRASLLGKQWILLLSKHSIRWSFLTIILGHIPHCSISSFQLLLSLYISLLQLKRFPWSDHCDLLAPYPLCKLKKLFPTFFTTKAHVLICSSFLLLFFWILSNISQSFLKLRCQTSRQFSGSVCVGATTVASLLCHRQVCLLLPIFQRSPILLPLWCLPCSQPVNFCIFCLLFWILVRCFFLVID